MKYKLLPLILLLWAYMGLHAQPGTIDATFDPGSGANSAVRTMALQPDGKILIGGPFTSYNGTGRNRIARLNADGSLDLSFDPGTGANSTVFAMALQPNGKILIGGDFTSYNGTARNFIARLNADGTLDMDFDPGSGISSPSFPAVYAIALQPNGKILIGGDFSSYDGTGRNSVARLNADGSLDVGFNPGTGTNGFVRVLVLQPGGKILIGGQFSSYNGTGRNSVVQVNADGNLDAGFNPGTGANNWVRAMALQPDGKILIGGDFTAYDDTGRNRVARVNGMDIIISGNILWEHDRANNPIGVPIATVALTGDGTGSDDTDTNGDYAIPTAGGNSLTLTPTKTGGAYEGVDAADVTRIQQHVTFVDRFDDGYKVIAADVNQSNSVTGLDAAVLFHAINGNPNAEFIFQTLSWRFVDSTHTFMDENNPWPFPDTIALMNIMASVKDQSFVAAKMGDVNGTWGAPPAPLSAPLNWSVPNLTLKAGQKLRIPFRADGLPDVAAWQFALRFDTDYLRFERALPTAAFPLKDENFGAWQAKRGELRSVFAVPQGLVLPKDEIIFELEFQVVYDGLQLSEVLSLDNDILDGRVYDTALNGGAVALSFEAVETRRIASLLPGEAALGFALEQNIPNPFSGETLIRFQLQEAGEAIITVRDLSGRTVYEQRADYAEGQHEIRLAAGRLAPGVLTYTLCSRQHMATRRMVLID